MTAEVSAAIRARQPEVASRPGDELVEAFENSVEHVLSSYVSDKPGSSLHLWPEDEAPTGKAEVAPDLVDCPACYGHGEVLIRVDDADRSPRGGRYRWAICEACQGAKRVARTPQA